MLKTFTTFIFLILVGFTFSQIKAITENGDEVLLLADGSWKYTIEQEQEPPIEENTQVYSKSKNSTFLLKSNKLNIGVWLDAKTWSFKKGESDAVNEYSFQKKSGDLYAMFISEKIQIPLDELKTVAIDNAKKVSTNFRLVKQEFRKVNGINVLMLQMSGNIKGIDFMYYGYYYSNENGTIQLITYTSEKLFKSYFNEIELFINGLVEL